MTNAERALLVRQAVQLTKLGAKVERSRERLRTLVSRGVAYDAAEMRAALTRFQRAEAEWKCLEAEHLALREQYRRE